MSARDRESTTAARSCGNLNVERFPNFDGELLGVERFWQEKHSRFATIVRLKRFLEIAGDEEDLDIWMNGAKSVGKATTAKLWHHHVGEQQVDPPSFVFG